MSLGVSAMVQWVKNPTVVAWVAMKVAGLILDLTQRVKGFSIATAALYIADVAWIQSLIWELAYATSAAIKFRKQKKKKKKKGFDVCQTHTFPPPATVII